MADLSGKHAIVTGGGSGVGAAVAQALAGSGASVAIFGRRLEALAETAGSSPSITALQADVTDPASLAAAFAQSAQHHGEASIVIANAGAAESSPFLKTDLDAWRRMLDVNLTGTFLTFQAALPSMVERKWGRLIAVASIAGLKGYGYVAPYCAAKHGVVGLTRALGVELARTGVTVNAVCPGYTETPMLERSIDTIVGKTGKTRSEAEAALTAGNPMGRFIQPEEVAAAVLWLCGPHSDAVTGQAIAISGGET